MRIWRVLSILVFVALMGTEFSLSAGSAREDQDYQVLSRYLVPHPTNKALARLAVSFEIQRRQGQDFEVIVPADQEPLLKEIAPQAILLEKDLTATVNKALREYKTNFALSYRYRDFREIQELLNRIAVEHSDIAQVIQYGTTPRGNPLLALKLSDNVQIDEDEPEVMLTAATHGDELITTEILLEIIDRLTKGHAADARLNSFINERELFFVPVVNPDGFVKRSRYDNGEDPNRSYPYPDDESVRPTPSIANLISFFHARQIKASIDFHAYGEMLMYPWAYTYDSIPQADRNRFDLVARNMAATNGYQHGPIAETIYVAQGSSADYYYWKKGTMAFAVELGGSKVPHPREFPEYIRSQLESTWIFLDNTANL